MNLLFVCTGNTCRSPMAEALARRSFETRGLSEWYASSAGVMAVPGAPASAEAVREMARRGLHLESHRSRELSDGLLEWADRVVTMTAAHKRRLIGIYPAVRSRTVTLGELAGAREDVPDPYGGGEAAYRRCADRLQVMVEEALDRLLGR